MIVKLKKRNTQYRDLTFGQPYVVIGIGADELRILNDAGRPFLYQPRLFSLVDPLEPVDWVTEFGDKDLGTQLTGTHRGHRVWQEAIATFAKEISFDQATKRAARWSLSPWVEVDPNVQYGQPIVRNTRVPVAVVVANLRAGSPDQVADWLGLTASEVKGARDYDASSRLSA